MKRGFRTATLALAGLFTLVGIAEITRAYTLGVARWPGRIVPYYVNPANGDVSESAALAAIQAGARAWSEQSNANIEPVYAGATTVRQNSVDYTSSVFFATDRRGGSTIAVTYYVYDSNRNLLDADVEFYDADRQFFTGSSGCVSGFYIEDVIAHEFGHLFGIDHSSVSDATMAPSISFCSTSARSLHADDIAAIEAKYPSRCDIDGGGVTVTDVQLSINQAIGLSNCTADINGDGRCDVIDVQRVVNTTLGLRCVTT